ncbi:hypothetical protein VP01_1648g1, partial [Puccinia sorghi]
MGSVAQTNLQALKTRPKVKATHTHCLARYKRAPLYLTRQCVQAAFIFGLVKAIRGYQIWPNSPSKPDDALLIWKSIVNYFASQHAANCARVWNHFSYLSFKNLDICGFITNIKSAIEQLHEVGINQDMDIIVYEIIKKLPKTPEFNSISTAITHSGAAITPELVIDHLCLHANHQAIEGSANSGSLQQVTLFANASKKCKTDAHNTLANHPESRCWKLYPHLCPTFDSSKANEGSAKHSVSSLFSSQSPPLPCVILDSGSTAHMTAVERKTVS